MKVLENAVMPDGTKIQLEEWHENYDFMPYADGIAAYPVSKANHKGSFSPKYGERYRAGFHFDSTDLAREAFYNLKSGNAVLKDYAKYLWCPEYADCL